MKTSGASMWRLSGDIKASRESIVSVAKNALDMEPIAGHGAWSDPDMIVAGRNIGGDCTLNECSSYFSLCCLLSAPLPQRLAGNRPQLLNRELIAINQDELGIQAYRLPPMSFNDFVSAKPLYGRNIAVCLLTKVVRTPACSFPYITGTCPDGSLTSGTSLCIPLFRQHFEQYPP